jgi:hypothetical protein
VVVVAARSLVSAAVIVAVIVHRAMVLDGAAVVHAGLTHLGVEVAHTATEVAAAAEVAHTAAEIAAAAKASPEAATKVATATETAAASERIGGQTESADCDAGGQRDSGAANHDVPLSGKIRRGGRAPATGGIVTAQGMTKGSAPTPDVRSGQTND